MPKGIRERADKGQVPLSFPRTIEEGAVWLEIPSQNIFEPAVIRMSSDYPYPVIAVLGMRKKPRSGVVDKNTYGVDWRCWLGKPTSGDMLAALWNGRQSFDYGEKLGLMESAYIKRKKKEHTV